MEETPKEATDVVRRRKYLGGIYLRSLYLLHLSAHGVPLDRTCQIVLFLSLPNASIVNICLNVLFLNGRSYIASAYFSYLSIFSYKCLFNIASVHLGTFSLPGASYGAP